MDLLLEHLSPDAFPNVADRLAEVARAAEALRERSGFAFLDSKEILARRDQIHENNSDFLDHILFVAEDAGGTLYGLWLRGKLTGMWAILDHNEIDISPAWRDVDDFIAHACEDVLTPSLPDIKDKASPEEHARWADVRELYAKNFQTHYDADHDSMYALFFAYSIIALTPRSEADALIPFLTLDNQWIAERAAATLGNYRHQVAIPALEELAKRDGNGALAARGALKQMGSMP